MDFTQFEGMDRRQICKVFRQMDESHKWPICGRFNVTERAIKRVANMERDCEKLYGMEYALALDRMISLLVNKGF